MFTKNDNLLEWVDASSKTYSKGLIGIEKESLRISQGNISSKPHNQALGSSLCNKFITTDFAEAQIELVTPPFSSNSDLFRFLDNIQHFVIKKLDDEYLWPFSIPPENNEFKDIAIAYYGKSNKAIFKHVYRNGLANRYGKPMQTISGMHINFSFSNSFWNSIKINPTDQNLVELKPEIYFRTIRNIERCNWLLLYLFGASPILCKSLISSDYNFSKINNEEYYLPYATSLRMSSMGYQNIGQSKLNISLNSLNDYILDLKSATETVSDEFSLLNSSIDGLNQLNSSLLQIEDEYYGISRPKSSNPIDIRQTSKLTKFGLDYLELRSLDLDPFSLHGIEERNLVFIELFILYCTINPSPIIDKVERGMINANNAIVSIEGRRRELKLIREGKEVFLSDWAVEIINEMEKISELFNFAKFNKDEYIEQAKKPEATISARILDQALINDQGFQSMAESLAKENQKRYKEIPRLDNEDWNLFEDETHRSLQEQFELDKLVDIPFSEYLENFYK